MFENYLCETELLDFKSVKIQELIKERKWRSIEAIECVTEIYNFVKNEILFGYNKSDDMKASDILLDGYGQCNTKAILMMSLLRGSGIPCRIHGFGVDKLLQFGIMSKIVYKNAPNEIIHSWVEIYLDGRWIALEGVILDDEYLQRIKVFLKGRIGPYMGYGIAVSNFEEINTKFKGDDTFIQSKAIINDYGVFNCPDEFLAKYSQNLGKFKRFLYKYVGRKLMNGNVKRIRKIKI